MKKTWLCMLFTLILIIGACESNSGADGDHKENTEEKIVEKEKTKVEGKVTLPSIEDEISAMLETNTDFLPFVEKYYTLPETEQMRIYEKSIHGKSILDWSGVVIENFGNVIIIYAGDPAHYNNEDWNTITLVKPELMPYSLVISMQENAQIANVNPGDIVSVTGRINVQGNKQEQSVWVLERGLIIQ